MPLRTWAPWLGLSERNGDAPDGGEVWRGEWGGAVKTKRVRIAVAIDLNVCKPDERRSERKKKLIARCVGCMQETVIELEPANIRLRPAARSNSNI